MWEGLEKEQCHCLASENLPGPCPIASHFTHSLCAAGTLPAVSLVVNSKVGGFAYVLSLCRPFKQSLLKIQWFFPPPLLPLVFQPEVMGIYLPGVGTLGCAVLPGARTAHSQAIPCKFYLPQVNVGPSIPPPSPSLHATPCLCASPPITPALNLLPVRMNVASLYPWFLDFYTTCFSYGSGCYLF